MAATKLTVGTFKFERSTKNTHVFTREVNGRNEPQYVQKAVFGDTPAPAEITVTLEFTK